MKNIFKIVLFSWVILQAQSCFVTRKYERPEAVLPSLDLFRPEYQQKDTQTIALMQWKEFFTDPILQQYLQEAIDSNLDYRIAQENIRASNAYYLQAAQAYFPTISIAPGASYNTQSLNTQFGQIIGERRHLVQYDITGSLTWEADIWGKLSSAKRAALADLHRTTAAQQALQTILVSNIASIYYQLLVLDEQKKITESTIETRTATLEATRALKDAGTLTEVAVKQNEALLLNAKALLVNLDNQIKVLENSFSILLSREPAAVKRGVLNEQQIISKLAYGVPYQILNNRPDVRAAEYNLISAFEMVNVAKANFYPALRITASSGLQSIDFDKIFSPQSVFANVVGSLTQPLWNKRALRTQHEVSMANQQIAYLNYKKSILTAGREVSDALIAYESQSSIEALKRQEYEAYQKATEYSQELVNYGLANYLEVLRAQENELNARLAVLNARYGKLNAIVQLYKALGGGWK